MLIRPIKSAEIMLLTDFVYEAIFQKDTDNLMPRTIIQDPSIWIYIDEFGSKKDDYCFVAEYENNILSARIIDDYPMDLIDLGIAKRHFEIGAGGKFEFGNGGIYNVL